MRDRYVTNAISLHSPERIGVEELPRDGVLRFLNAEMDRNTEASEGSNVTLRCSIENLGEKAVRTDSEAKPNNPQ